MVIVSGVGLIWLFVVILEYVLKNLNLQCQPQNSRLDILFLLLKGSLMLWGQEWQSILCSQLKQIGIEISKNSDERDLLLCEKLASACFDSEDYKEGRKAFMEKRKPNFQGL